MEHTDRDELRRLALWLSRRRVVDEAVGALTAYGPAACDRVHSHLDALRTLLAAEQDAFDALIAKAPVVPQLPLPELVEGQLGQDGGPFDAGAQDSGTPYGAAFQPGPHDGHRGRGATVHSLGAARDRHG